LYVAADVEPARIAIGSILRTRHMSDSRREGRTIYAHGALNAWFLAKLSARVGFQPEALSASADRRAEQARRLMPADLTDTCATRPAVLLQRSDWKRADVKKPRVLSEVKPVYPKDELEGRRESKILFEAEITEHGTLVNLHHLEPAGVSEDFKLASQLAGSLWRFEPGIDGPCRVRMTATFEMSFMTR